MEDGLAHAGLLESLLVAGAALALLLIATELSVLHFRHGSLRLRESRMAFLALFLQLPFRALTEWLLGSVAIMAFAVMGAWLSPLEAGTSPAAWLVGFAVYEFFYWLYHYLGHHVRLLWCGHAAHHSPESMTLLAGTNANPIDSEIHLVVIVGLGCGLCGLPPLMVLAFNLVDRSWAAFLHASEWLMPRGNYGFLHRFMQTPSLHRVHHGRNPVYKDRNLAPVTQLWDRVMGTFQPLLPDEPPDYGITRRPDTGSVLDVHFGEYKLLWQDLRAASGLWERLAIAFGPPGRLASPARVGAPQRVTS